MSVHLTFYPFLTLSSEGDSVEFEDSFRQENFPEKAKAAACKTQAEVLEFLKSIKSEGRENRFVFRHLNHWLYAKNHISHRAESHFCNLKELIKFIEERLAVSKRPALPEVKVIKRPAAPPEE